MSIEERKVYVLKCDGCGRIDGSDDEYQFWIDRESAEVAAEYGAYLIQGDKHYCSDCWEHDDDDNLIIKNKQV